MEEWRGLRITTWNVNGIRNPFSYQPWRLARTFPAMFDILEADIVVMQETKIQRKDLQDDMVLVPGWDVYFSLPKHKKGYSGVAIYTRSSVCAPIRAEEGITGVLTPPNSSTSFFDLPKDQQIGGYPTIMQLAECPLDAATLDSEGRCVILEFPAFVLIGVYNPATRDETRDEFRIGFLNALDARVRNLVAAGKRVFLTGDLNIVRDRIDSAKTEEQLKKQGMSFDDYISRPASRMLNQLLVDGRVIGERDEGRENGVMLDICRSFHPDRKGMFTCWEQKINARPGNFGSRIDYVLCSKDWGDWFCDSNIQEGLMGSDHCPVYAMLKEKVDIDGYQTDIRDLMSDGMFKNGVRQREWSPKDLLPTSAKLIPEFDRRRSIRDMFSKKPALPVGHSSLSNRSPSQDQTGSSTTAEAIRPVGEASDSGTNPVVRALGEESTDTQTESKPTDALTQSRTIAEDSQTPTATDSTKPITKRSSELSSSASQPQKRSKLAAASKSAAAKGQPGKGQSSLTGFFKPKLPQVDGTSEIQSSSYEPEPDMSTAASLPSEPSTPDRSISRSTSLAANASPNQPFNLADQKDVVDPIVAKESWSKLLGKRVLPRCEHNETCISYVTKKPGINCGRSFFTCPRPLGPSGQKEKNTQWRCNTFIWSSDWTGDGV